MLKMVIEEKMIGPLSNPGILRKLETAVETARSLDEAVRAIQTIPVFETYRGGSHIAVHQRLCRQVFATRNLANMGSVRLAIITEEVFPRAGEEVGIEAVDRHCASLGAA